MGETISFKNHLAFFLRENYPEAYKRVLLKKEAFVDAAEKGSDFMYEVPQDDPFMINSMCKEIQALEEEQLRKVDG